MKRTLALLTSVVLTAFLLVAHSTGAQAQSHSLSADQVVLQAGGGHTMTIETPPNPSAAYTAWSDFPFSLVIL